MASFAKLIILNAIHTLTVTGTEWISHDAFTPLPRNKSDMAVGVVNQTIWLLGGYDKQKQFRRQVIVFIPTVDSFYEAGNTLTVEAQSSSQFYTQINQILYFTNVTGDVLNSFNLETNELIPTWSNLPPGPPSMDGAEYAIRSCLTDNTTHLVIIGGGSQYKVMRDVSVMSISTGHWEAGPSMKSKRQHLSCISNPLNLKQIFAFGGKTGGNINDYTETIELIDFELFSSEYFNGSLSQPSSETRAIVYADKIWIFGGYNGLENYYDSVHILDPSTMSIELASERLAYGVCATAAVVLQDVIYLFGGNTAGGQTANWMSYAVTASPTSLPTSLPTSSLIPLSPTTTTPTSPPTSPKVTSRLRDELRDVPKWLLILSQDVSTKCNLCYFNVDITMTGVENVENPQSNTFSIVGALNETEFSMNNAANDFQFRLIYNDGDVLSNGQVFDETWTQKSWLMDTDIFGSSLGNPDPTSVDVFYGLGLSDQNGTHSGKAFLDGNGVQTSWYHAVGTTTQAKSLRNGFMPLDNSCTECGKKVKLYICTNGNCDNESERIECYIGPTDEMLCESESPTSNPTSDPTQDPIMLTTEDSEIMTTTDYLNPTSDPTIFPTHDLSPMPTLAFSTTEYYEYVHLEDMNLPLVEWIIVFVGCVLSICCFFGVILCVHYYMKSRQSTRNEVGFLETALDTNKTTTNDENDQKLPTSISSDSDISIITNDQKLSVPKQTAQGPRIETLDVTAGLSETEINKTAENRLEIQEWLRDVVHLENYFDNFVTNGYESMEFVQEIKEKSDLEDIGIVMIGHQKKILSAIKDLKEDEGKHVTPSVTPSINDSMYMQVYNTKHAAKPSYTNDALEGTLQTV